MKMNSFYQRLRVYLEEEDWLLKTLSIDCLFVVGCFILGVGVITLFLILGVILLLITIIVGPIILGGVLVIGVILGVKHLMKGIYDYNSKGKKR